ncbi:MAG: hypothetical protein J6P07_01795, partial [Spirochaetaceae bacterium]|nr:hypothetical protein [Spirochaetaceae bacterium]
MELKPETPFLPDFIISEMSLPMFLKGSRSAVAPRVLPLFSVEFCSSLERNATEDIASITVSNKSPCVSNEIVRITSCGQFMHLP